MITVDKAWWPGFPNALFSIPTLFGDSIPLWLALTCSFSSLAYPDVNEDASPTKTVQSLSRVRLFVTP